MPKYFAINIKYKIKPYLMYKPNYVHVEPMYEFELSKLTGLLLTSVFTLDQLFLKKKKLGNRPVPNQPDLYCSLENVTKRGAISSQQRVT